MCSYFRGIVGIYLCGALLPLLCAHLRRAGYGLYGRRGRHATRPMGECGWHEWECGFAATTRSGTLGVSLLGSRIRLRDSRCVGIETFAWLTFAYGRLHSLGCLDVCRWDYGGVARWLTLGGWNDVKGEKHLFFSIR